MIWHICPECKEILSGDELRGSNSSCKACSMRKDRSDLIEIDSEHPEEFQGEQNTKAQEEQKSCVPALLLDNIALVPGTNWENIPNGDNSRMLVINYRSISGVLLSSFGMLFVASALCVVIYGFAASSVLGIVFCAILFIMACPFFYIGLEELFGFVWISINQNSIGIRRGLFRNGKFTVFARTSKDTNVKVINSNNFKYGSIEISDGNKSKTIINRDDLVSMGRAEGIANVIRMLLNARI